MPDAIPNIPPYYDESGFFPIPDSPLAIQYAKQWKTVPLHHHAFDELVFVAQGSAVHTIIGENGKKQCCGLIPGDVFHVAPGEWHGYEHAGSLILYNLFLNRSVLEQKQSLLPCEFTLAGLLPLREKNGVRQKIHFSGSARDEAQKCLSRLHRELTLRPNNFRLAAGLALADFLLLVSRAKQIDGSNAFGSEPGIARTLARMQSSPESRHTLTTLAREAAMSMAAYKHKFAAATGLPPIEYLIRLRVERIRMQLENSERSMTEIAANCGFCSANHMIRTFRKYQNITPLQYRKMFRAQATLMEG